MKLVNVNTIIKILLILFGLYLTISLVSFTIDGDFGWHLRFGQDAVLGNFQYTDNYTWSSFDKSWVNHEWGGDIIFYLLYNSFGYFSLVLLVSITLWTSFLLINKIFLKKIGIISILTSIVCLLATDFIITMRLAMFAVPFLVLLIYLLENVNNKKIYYYLPIIIWLWSFIHGSWILGFVIINIYLFSNIVGRILNWKKILKLDNLWSNIIIKKIVMWQLISGIIIMINPYGYKIWHEVILYFTNSYYKMHITEWLPSYTYPIYIAPLLIASFCAVILYLAFKNKKANLVHVFLFTFFFISAFQYKRNNLFLALVCIPILTYTATYIIKEIKWEQKTKKIVGYCLLIIITSSICLIKKPTIRYTNNIWDDTALLEYYNFPVAATKFLTDEIKENENIKIFNEYSWGGYILYNMPKHKIFLDGRSAATWKDSDGKLMLKKQIELMTKEGGLKYIKNNGVQYIILRNNYSGYQQPNWINNRIFGDKKIKIIKSNIEYQLITDLKESSQWIQIYHDSIGTIWKLTTSQS